MDKLRDEELEKLEADLHEKLDHPDGDSEEEQVESRKRSLETLTEILAEIKCRKRMKSVSSSSMAGHSTTIIAEQATNIFCKDLTPQNVTRWADQLKDFFVRTNRHSNPDQLSKTYAVRSRQNRVHANSEKLQIYRWSFY